MRRQRHGNVASGDGSMTKTSRTLIGLTIVAVVLAGVAALVVSRMMGSDNRAVVALYEDIAALGYGELFAASLEPSLARGLPAEGVDAPREVGPATAALMDRLAGEIVSIGNSPEWAALESLMEEKAVGDWSPREWESIAAFVSGRQKALDGARDLASTEGPLAVPEPYPRLGTEVPYRAELRRLAGMVHLRACLQAHGGDMTGALDSLEAVFGLAHLAGQNPQSTCLLFQNHLSARAVWTLEDVTLLAPPSPEQADRVLDLLARQLPLGDMTATLVVETATHLNTLEDARGGLGVLQIVDNLNPRSAFRADPRELKATFGELIACGALPYPEAAPRLAALNAAVSQAASVSGVLASMTISGLAVLPASAARAETQIQMARVGLAVEQYIAREGHAPPNLEAVAPILGGAVPGDPFTGEPFIYRPEDDGFVLYSVGMNLADDGGLHHDQYGDCVWRGVKASPEELFPDGMMPMMPMMPGMPPGMGELPMMPMMPGMEGIPGMPPGMGEMPMMPRMAQPPRQPPR